MDKISIRMKIIKRISDLIISIFGLIIFSWIILFLWVIASADTKGNGFFLQKRVGRNGSNINVIKIRTMRTIAGLESTITTKNDPRITLIGAFFRKWKLDELPTLWNVIVGDMSLVGPRPDVPGYTDKLKGVERRILELRPGITGPATLKYSNEEQLLAGVNDPVKFNDNVIFPDKVKINLEYIENWSLWGDIKIIFNTIFRSNY